MSNLLNFYSHTYTYDIARGIYLLDQYIRRDISDAYIVSEPDYVSTLMSYIRLFLRSNQLVKSLYGFQFKQQSEQLSSVSKILPKGLEQKFGCDALILIRANNKAKICMFEAKLPRIQSNTIWDYYQTSSHKSHFHDQLTRQSEWTSSVIIWELFINDYPFGSSLKGFDKYGSTCIWHEDAYKYSSEYVDIDKIPYYKTKKPELWNNNHLKNCVSNLTYNPLNLEDILNSVLFNQEDKAINIENDSIILKSTKGKNIKIPVTANLIKENKYIFEEAGIRNFLFIEL